MGESLPKPLELKKNNSKYKVFNHFTEPQKGSVILSESKFTHIFYIQNIRNFCIIERTLIATFQ